MFQLPHEQLRLLFPVVWYIGEVTVVAPTECAPALLGLSALGLHRNPISQNGENLQRYVYRHRLFRDPGVSQ